MPGIRPAQGIDESVAGDVDRTRFAVRLLATKHPGFADPATHIAAVLGHDALVRRGAGAVADRFVEFRIGTEMGRDPPAPGSRCAATSARSTCVGSRRRWRR